MQDNLVSCIRHILLQFWLRTIRLRLSTDNGHCGSPICHVTPASAPAKKRKVPWYTAYFLVLIQCMDRYEHRSIRFCISIVSEMTKSELFQMWFTNLWPRNSCNIGESWLRMHKTMSVSCQTTTRFGWFQHRIQSVIWQFCCMIITI